MYPSCPLYYIFLGENKLYLSRFNEQKKNLCITSTNLTKRLRGKTRLRATWLREFADQYHSLGTHQPVHKLKKILVFSQ
jgi:hypothetical protein